MYTLPSTLPRNIADPQLFQIKAFRRDLYLTRSGNSFILQAPIPTFANTINTQLFFFLEDELVPMRVFANIPSLVNEANFGSDFLQMTLALGNLYNLDYFATNKLNTGVAMAESFGQLRSDIPANSKRIYGMPYIGPAVPAPPFLLPSIICRDLVTGIDRKMVWSDKPSTVSWQEWVTSDQAEAKTASDPHSFWEFVPFPQDFTVFEDSQIPWQKLLTGAAVNLYSPQVQDSSVHALTVPRFLNAAQDDRSCPFSVEALNIVNATYGVWNMTPTPAKTEPGLTFPLRFSLVQDSFLYPGNDVFNILHVGNPGCTFILARIQTPLPVPIGGPWPVLEGGRCVWELLNEALDPMQDKYLFRLSPIPNEPPASLQQLDIAFGGNRTEIVDNPNFDAFHRILPWNKVRLTSPDGLTSIGLPKQTPLTGNLWTVSTQTFPFPDLYQCQLLWRRWPEKTLQPPNSLKNSFNNNIPAIKVFLSGLYQYDYLQQDFSLLMGTPGDYASTWFDVKTQLATACCIPNQGPTICADIADQFGEILTRTNGTVTTVLPDGTVTKTQLNIGEQLGARGDACQNYITQYCNSRIDPTEVIACRCLYPKPTVAIPGLLVGRSMCFDTQCWSGSAYLFPEQVNNPICSTEICFSGISVSGESIWFKGQQIISCGTTTSSSSAASATDTQTGTGEGTSPTLFADPTFLMLLFVSIGIVVFLIIILIVIAVLRKRQEQQQPPLQYVVKPRTEAQIL